MAEAKEPTAAEAAKAKPEAAKAPVKEYFEEKGAESAKNRASGGKDVSISLTNKTKVEFTKDYKGIKKGHTQEVSDVAYEIYKKADVVKKV